MHYIRNDYPEYSMRISRHIILFSVICIMSCTTTNNSKIHKNNVFPITVLSGEVTLHLTCYENNDNSIESMTYFFADSNAKTRMDVYNKEQQLNNILIQKESIIETKRTGEAFYYPVDANQTVTVYITPTSESAVIECSSVEYTIIDKDVGVLLVFRYNK